MAEQLELINLYLFGKVPGNLIVSLFAIMIIDIITGIMKAIKNKNLFTRTAFGGYAKKIGVFCLIILANIIDTILNLNGLLAYGTVLFYIATEGLSVLENLAELGLHVPATITEKLKVMQEENNKQDKGA